MEPSLSTVKRLFALSRNRCSFPECHSPIVEESGTVTGVICHIKGRSEGGPRYDPKQTDKERHAFNNLILMCGRHSKLIDSEPNRFTVDWLREVKVTHESEGSIKLIRSEARKAELLLKDYRALYISAGGHVMLGSPGAIQANNVVIMNRKKSVQILPPEGSLASELSKRNYIKHLIDRYNEFASQQRGRKFSYAAIYGEITKRFGAKWDLVPIHLFEDLASFLQSRIDRTMRGRVNRGKGIRNYSTYGEFRQKYEDQQEPG